MQDDQKDDAGQQDDEGDEELAVGKDSFSGSSFRSYGHRAVAPGMIVDGLIRLRSDLKVT